MSHQPKECCEKCEGATIAGGFEVPDCDNKQCPCHELGSKESTAWRDQETFFKMILTQEQPKEGTFKNINPKPLEINEVLDSVERAFPYLNPLPKSMYTPKLENTPTINPADSKASSPSQPNEQWVDRTFKEILAGAEFAEEMERECLRHMEKMLIKAIASRDSDWKAVIEELKYSWHARGGENAGFYEGLGELIKKMSNPKEK